MSPDKDLSLAIVGGGIGGLCLALYITTHTKIPVTVYENAPKFGEIGAGVAFGPNAVRAITKISEPLAAAVEARANRNIFADKENIWFDFRVGMDSADETARARGVVAGTYLCSVEHPEPGSWMVNRSHLVDEIAKLLPTGIAQFSKALHGIDDLGDNGVLLKFGDGTSARHSAVIGCDGIKSQTRRIMLGEDHPATNPSYTGKYCYRGMVPMDKAVELLGEEKAKNCQAYLGYHGHMLTFPVAGGRMMNVVAFQSSKEWPHKTMVIPATKEQMLQSFSTWGPDVLNIVRLMGQSGIWALFDLSPMENYHKGRICLLGDAAHASTPFQGAGAGMAVEDAYVLGRLLHNVQQAQGLPGVFKSFSRARVERTQNLVATSREAGHLWHFEAEEDDLVKITEIMKNRMSWIWDKNLDDDIAQVTTNSQRADIQD
ncbi:mannitol 1-phosphate dehydrogenase [Colletotrichum tamarilloi]|uniref:Mannitol 1-phosphate dehydrogenase n=1 Tax=Colletotrichum tamarilloi TaxID=1209934 RepID=A0ABQ9QHL3_9PEZI|nr:mannitol 1-phosphate dehydrogenase [Colletotrichum tamarilloi]KAK1470486.1 mannitol 1-phosphate dehydrogenase [Colletotrichum tamarilloi]